MCWFSFWIGTAPGIILGAAIFSLLGKNFLSNNSEALEEDKRKNDRRIQERRRYR